MSDSVSTANCDLMVEYLKFQYVKLKWWRKTSANDTPPTHPSTMLCRKWQQGLSLWWKEPKSRAGPKFTFGGREGKCGLPEETSSELMAFPRKRILLSFLQRWIWFDGGRLLGDFFFFTRSFLRLSDWWNYSSGANSNWWINWKLFHPCWEWFLVEIDASGEDTQSIKNHAI